MPTVLGSRFELLSRLGEGGMATVYRALDRKTGEHCAVKVLLPKFAERPSLRSRFAAEAEAMSRIHHRNVVHVFEVGLGHARPFFAMELAEGGCLIDWIETHGPMPPRLATDVAIQLCKGIGAAHRIGVIHRDIKPHNILMNRRGVCKITDFGIAQFEDDAASMTRTGSVMGTLGYIAPEQRANAKDVDERTDIYSIGATLFTMVTARTTMDLFFADQEPEMLDGVFEALIPVILRATRYRRDDRYPTVRHLAKALFELKASLPEDPPGTPALVLTGSHVEGTELQAVDSTFERTVPFGGPPTHTDVTASFAHGAPGDRTAARAAPQDDPHLRPDPGVTLPVPSSSAHRGPPPLPPGLATTSGEGDVAPGTSLPPTISPLDEIDYPKRGATPSIARDRLLRHRKEASPPIDVRRAKWPLAGVAALFVVMGIAAGMVLFGRSQVAEAEAEALLARDSLFERLSEERRLPEFLVDVGGDAPTVRAAWERALTGTGEERVAHVRALVTVARAELGANANAFPGSDRYGRAKEVQGSLDRIETAQQAYQRERMEWRQATETPLGALAVSLGLGNVPAD